MSFRSLGNRVRNLAERRHDRQRANKRFQSRRNLVQQLEDRRLLAGPELIAIRPDSGALLRDGDTLNSAPSEFNLQFRAGADIDEASITTDSIKLVRSGGDGTFGDGNEVDVVLGYVGLENPGDNDPTNLQRIVFRTSSSAPHNATDPANAFPDDTYQIQVYGAGSSVLTNLAGEAFNDGNNEFTTFRLDRGAQVVAVVPQPISYNPLSQATDEIVVYFDDQPLDPSQVEDPAFYRLVNTSDTINPADDSTSLPESVTYDPAANRVTLKFASAIPEGNYRLDVGQSGGDNSTTATAIQVGSLNDSNQFAQNGFLGDFGGVSDNAADVDLFRVQLNAGTTLNVTVTPQAAGLNTHLRVLDANETPLDSNIAGPGLDNVLSFPVGISGEYFLEISSADGSTGSYRLAAGVTGSPLSTDDDNSTFDTATGLGMLGAAEVRITSNIRRQPIPIPPRAGSEDEPGHRVIQREAHIGAIGTTPSLPASTRIRTYYFPDTLGVDTNGDPYINLITEKEKQIIREIFEIYAKLSGYEFRESSVTVPFGDDLMIGKGDFRAVSPTLGPNDGVAGLASSGFALANGAIYDQANRFFGDGFTSVMFHEIGHSLGLGHSYDIPSNMGSGVPNDVLPGDHDVVHLQRIVPPNSTDIDMYRFSLSEAGRLKAETIAERLSTPSLLNTAMSLYQEIDGGWELIARNDQYFGADSFLDLHLEPGNYAIGISSTGNTDYDPRVPDSGFGGTTDGAYELKLSFDAEQDGVLVDTDGTAFDGDADGTPGGVYSFWFQSNDPDTTIFVGKQSDFGPSPEGDGRLTSPFDSIETALQQAGSRIVVPLDAVGTINNGEQFVIDDGTNVATFRFGTLGANPVDISGASTAADVAAAIQAAVAAAKAGGRLNTSVSVSVSTRIVQFDGIDTLNIAGSPTLISTPNPVRILANGGDDGDLTTALDNRPYLVGQSTSGAPLDDGAEFLVPQGVNVMIEAGALFKMRRANIDAGSSSANISRSNSSIQVLGTPEHSVLFRSYHNDAFGGDSDGVGPSVSPGDFGGIVFRGDSDLDAFGSYLNYVNHADIDNGGGNVFVDANELPFAPIYITDARPTVSFNRITNAKSPAISASPDAFDDSNGRIGPDVAGNYLEDNAVNGLFIRVKTPLGSTIDKLDVSGRFDDADIPHVLSENLIISGAAGGPILTPSRQLLARASGRLVVDPGVIVKLDLSRIEVERGGGALIAEGTLDRPVIFTSISDDRYGGSGTFNSDPTSNPVPAPADWGGLYFGQATSGSIDNALIAYGGGSTSLEGGAAPFNAIEIHQADVRIANSLLQSNAGGGGGGQRNGRGGHSDAVIYVRGAQPIILDNTIVDNDGPAININANAMRFETQRDSGRSTGRIDRYSLFDDNRGPLVRLNELDDNSINGMQIRGEVLTTETVWDDTDMVHVIAGEVVVGNHHTYSGLTLQSSNSESLVVKATNGSNGFTATGKPQEIIDRIGGTIHILGTPGHPVVLTSLSDDTVGAGFTPNGDLNSNTNNSANPTIGTPGQWRGLLFDEFSNDRNVAIVREAENPLTNGNDVNGNHVVAQNLGVIAPDQKSGDENRRLGFVVKGYISPTDADDVDVYSFNGTAGTEVWIDIDRTDTNLDAIVEVINAAGTVLARSVGSGVNDPGNLNDDTLTKNPLLGGDHYTQNFRDPGFRYVLPGTPGQTGTYFVRVRSNPASLGDVTALAGESRGEYQLQLRLDQVQEFAGSTVRFADIRFAETGIDVRGLPAHSPLIGEAGETNANNNTFTQAQQLVNLLETDVAALGISGNISNETDADWYRFSLEQTGVQVIAGVNDSPGTIAVVLDLDYSDKAVRADTTVAVFDEDGNLVFIGRESNVEDDRNASADGSIDDLSRGSLGTKDAYIGPIHLTPGGDFYVAVMSDRLLPTALTGIFQANPANAGNGLVRLEPVNSVSRIVEDHLGFQGYSSRGIPIFPETPQGLFDINTLAGVGMNVKPFTLQDVALYVATDERENDDSNRNSDHLYTVDAFQSSRWLTRVSDGGGINGGVNDVQDVVIRTDGRMYGYQRLNDNTSSVGALVSIDPETGNITPVGNDNINGQTPTPNTSSYSNQIQDNISRTRRADQFTTSDEVDALTFRRVGTTGPAAAPTPIYDVYYAVRESDTSSKLYLATESGDATLTLNARNTYGVKGDIQPADVNYQTYSLTVRGTPPANGATPQTTIRLKSKVAGLAGAFDLVINPNRPNNTNAVVNVTGNTIILTLGGTGGPPITGAPTAQAIVDEINNDPAASRLVTAVIYSGNADNRGNGATGTPAITTSAVLTTAASDGADGPLAGRVTGLSFSNFFGTGNLYGVTDAGEFLEINPNTGDVINRVDATNAIGEPDLEFQGLTLGPQNLEGGAYKNVLFAVTSRGQLVAFDTSGNGFVAFESGGAAQLLTTGAGPDGGFFTLTTDAGVFGRQTTDPIASDAPSYLSVNETQTINTTGSGSGGTFTLSMVVDQGAVTSPAFDLDATQTLITVQDASDFPATPFNIQIGTEQMRVDSATGNAWTVTRGINGTFATAHADTATVFEKVTSLTTSSLSLPNGDFLSAAINDTTLTIPVFDASAFPAVPFTIRIQDEEMQVNFVDTIANELTVDQRGDNGTSAAHHSNFRSVTIVSETLTVLDATPFPSSGGFNIRIGGEDLRVTGVVPNPGDAGAEFTVIRGANGTLPGTHAFGSDVARVDTTTPIPYNAPNFQIRSAIAALPVVGGLGNVIVSGGPLNGLAVSNPVNIEFVGSLAAKDLPLLTADETGLVGDEIQQISLDPNVNAGDFALSFRGATTAALAWDASASDVQTALENLVTIGPGNVIVTGSTLAAGALSVRFTGDLQDQNVSLLTVPAATENLLQNEIQQFNVTGGPNGGSFTLELASGPVTGVSAPIAWDAPAAAVQAALEQGIPALNGNIIVTGTGALPGGTINIEFTGTYASTDIAQFIFNNALTGGTAPTIVVTTVQTTNAPSPSIVETRAGISVDVPIAPGTDGILSVRDALIGLPTFNPADVKAAGVLNPPGNGVLLNFVGQYAGVDLSLLEIDNSLNLPSTAADISLQAAVGSGVAGSFIMDVSGLNTNGADAIGLAFSPLDFNLWHPTTLRATDDGHGINEAEDDTRVPSDADEFYDTPGSFREFDQSQGGVSYQFGLEQWVLNQNSNSQHYLQYLPGVNAQYGILTTEFHADLSSNPEIVGDFGNGVQGSYNLPAGGYGTLETGSFNLNGTVPADRPTLYFSYFLETEGDDGSNLDNDDDDPFRDSARVFISADGGASWDLLASNNSQLSAADPTDGPGTAELPGFLSHLSDAGRNSGTPRADSQQVVQELFDNTGQWRQARVDLSQYAGLTGLMLRIDFSSAGSVNDSTLGRIDTEYDPNNATDVAEFGEYVARGSEPRSIRSLDNQHQGFFVDDFIIGYAERGEMVTGTNGDAGLTNLFAGGARTRDNDPEQFPDVLNGPYQLEIRRTDEHVVLTPDGPVVGVIFDTNDRHVDEATETAFLSFEPATFVPDLTPQDTSVLGGFTAAEIDPWSVTATNPDIGAQSLESGPLGTNRVSIFEVTRAELGSTTSSGGVIRFAYDVNSALDTHGLRFLIDGVPQRLVNHSGEEDDHDPTLASGVTGYVTAEFTFGSGNPTFTWVYDFTDTAPAAGDNRAFIDNVQLLQGGTGLLADRNRERAQGNLILDSNFISDSSVRGINVQPGATQAGGSVPHPGSTINFPQLNTERLVPGVVIQNNVISGSSGIRFAGENNSVPQRPVPFGRLINNTLVGGGRSGTGIEIVGLASPTLMNNLITDFNVGISNGGTGTVIRSNFFQDNTNNGSTGTASIIAPDTAPLFVDAAAGNYYLVDASTARDSSQNTEQDRLNYLTFKTELGIPASPINAPLRDAFGQLRVDPNASALGDRGALEDTDIDSPYAVILNPIDNDSEGNDRDPSDTVIWVTDPLLENFTFFLGDGRDPNSPFEGTGVDGLTVDDPNDDTISDQAIEVTQDGVPLIQGEDYIVGYNELSGILRLTPLSTLWEPSSVYIVNFNNQLIADRAGNLLRSNQRNGDTRFTIIIPDVEIDFGDAPDTYRTLLASDGPRHVISQTGLPALGTFVDGDDDGNPSAGADGDDLTGVAGDDDGLYVGAFQGTTTTTEGLFLADGVPSPTMDAADVIAFLDRNDRAGAVLPIAVSGTGKLDIWVDFNRDGDFLDQGEKVASGLDVVDGVNNVRVFTPANAATGLTYARVRLSPEGSFDPFGLAIGGEVEDYRVNVVDISEPVPVKDSYTVNEDEVLVVDGTAGSQPTLLANDTLPGDDFVNERVVIDLPLKDGTTDTYETTWGEVRLDDASLGLFTYTPNSDYHGPDSFRYRVSKQRNDGPEADAAGIFVTVTIDVAPVNDAPRASDDINLAALEYQPGEGNLPQEFLASDLLADAVADQDIMIDQSPWNESNQILKVISITVTTTTGDVTLTDNGQSATTLLGGTISADFVTEPVDPNDATSPVKTFITKVYYQGADYFNSDNLRADSDPRILDTFSFTIEDDGRSLDQNGDPVAGTPLSDDAQANILVAPRNSDPLLSSDLVSTANDRYNNFYLDQSLEVPVPTEDNELTIPAAFLLGNDAAGASAAADENQGVNGNDGALEIISVSMDPQFGTVAIDPVTGDVVFTPAANIYGQVEFTYEVQDMGVDEELDGTRNVVPRTSTVTSTIFVEPVNDAPVAYDRALGMTEAVEPAGPAVLTFTADDLLDGVSPITDSPITTTADSITLVDGSELVDGQTLVITDINGQPTVVELSTSTTASIGTDLLLTYSTSDLADDLATGLATLLANAGLTGVASGPTVTLVDTTSIVVTELANVPGDFDVNLGSPYDESEQAIRIVSFTTPAGNVTVASDFTGTETLATPEGGLLTLNFVDGAFTDGTYQPAVDYNRLSPFQPFDQFTYGVVDDGQTTLPISQTVRSLAEEPSVQEATVTITVEPANDSPFIENVDSVDVPEDPSPAQATINNVFTTVLPGPLTAQDELQDQGRPTVDPLTGIQVTDPDGVMADLPIVTAAGGLTVFPNANTVGEVIYVFTFTDDHPTDAKSTDVTVTVNVRPVNDPPQFNPDVTGTSDNNGADDQYAVAEVIDPNTNEIIDGTITYTLKEDNTQANGDVGTPFFIPLRRDPNASGYNRVGLLDVFVVGPDNEADPNAEGGNQTLSLDQIPTRTDLGGTLTLGVDGFGNPGVFYTPPVNYNANIGPVDSFSYTVIDDGTTHGGGGVTADPQTSANFVRFVLNPVNDRPQFEVNLLPVDFGDPNSPLRSIEVVEDSDPITFDNFAFDIEPAPPSTAFDEVDVINGQSVQFTVSPLSFDASLSGDYFTSFPQITPTGVLTFQPAPDVFGSFDFEIVLVDDGADDLARGDLNESNPVTITIDVLPQNDPPVVRTDVDPLEFSINEDGSLDIFNVGVGNDRGLLDVFAVGPDNEGQDLTPGGNQTLQLQEPTPVQTAFGGSITQIRDDFGNLIGLRYTPRPNFVGTDSFIYTVTDDGTTVDIGSGGTERADARIAANSVSILVTPVNNTPQYSGPVNVIVDEDAGAVTIDDWAVNVLPGPRTALDEINTQDVFFTVTQISGDPNLFTSAPVAVVDGDSDTASLQFETAGDANGVASFEVVLTDVPADGTPAASTAPRTFTLRINAVNDPPTFDRVANPVTVNEDSGPYSQPWASNISPGPADELSQTVRFEVSTPVDAESLFQQDHLPAISDDGVLRFIPAANANGTVDLTVTAIDSQGESSVQEVLQLVITAVNDRPTAVADTVSTNEDSVLSISVDELLDNDIDPDINNPSDSLSIIMAPESFSLSGARVLYDEATGVITYDPSTSIALQALTEGSSGVDSFNYRIVDSQGAQSNIVSVAVTVEGRNDAPVARPDNPTLNPSGPTIIEVLQNDTDADGVLVPTSIQVTLQPAFGSLSIDDEGVVTYTAFQSFALEDVFRYRVADDNGEYSNEGLVTIAANAAPIARRDQVSTFINETIVINVAANDADPDAAAGAPNRGLDLTSIQIVDSPLSGDVVPLGDGTIRYIPAEGFLGIDSFTYTIADLAGRVSSPGTVQVQVTGSRLQNPNLKPDVNDDGNISPIDALLVINHLARQSSASIPVEDTDAGPPYYDVNGDKLISPSDALAVINELARGQANGGLGEMVEAEHVVAVADSDPVAPVITSDIIDLLADEDDDEDDRIDALDAAFGDLI
ncbi:tandem-95 repeat protein [Stieleria mannarensis]|uniref:tandem-95 repeat protein n=1 Tax=Stieleria mannarensis TaxID=2755585 RepID=UPI0015FF2C3F|nr:tandem-95 repeat protein [Rhodopirellula sp. JC639]